jgi:hypothetical protein
MRTVIELRAKRAPPLVSRILPLESAVPLASFPSYLISCSYVYFLCFVVNNIGIQNGNKRKT